MANDTRTRMLDATGRLLRQRGYHGTSLNDILAASGAPRGSLYFHFPGGKDQLVIEVTRASVAAVAERLRRYAGHRNPAWRGDQKDLCGDGANAGREFRDGLPGRSGRSRRHQRGTRTRRARPSGIRASGSACFRRRSQGQAFQSKRARTLALLVESSIEGLMIIARATRDSSVLLGVADELAALVEAAAGKTG